MADETRLREGYFSVKAYRSMTRDRRYWERLAEMSPEEKILWVDRTREMVLALQEAFGKWRNTR